jgi:YgiT-type zinc finger domain-containing protein
MTQPELPIGTKCPECGKGQLIALTRTEEFDFDLGEEKVKVRAESVPVQQCDRCGEVLSGLAAAKVRHEAVCRAAGLLTPTEYKSIREQLEWAAVAEPELQHRPPRPARLPAFSGIPRTAPGNAIQGARSGCGLGQLGGRVRSRPGPAGGSATCAWQRIFSLVFNAPGWIAPARSGFSNYGVPCRP